VSSLMVVMDGWMDGWMDGADVVQVSKQPSRLERLASMHSR
jgi:hypothetical protein